eukprot:678977_1
MAEIREHTIMDDSGKELLLPVSESEEESVEIILSGDGPAYKLILVVTLALFQGYAILIAFQKKLERELGIANESDPRSKKFHAAYSFLYLGNLFFRLLHNIAFA